MKKLLLFLFGCLLALHVQAQQIICEKAIGDFVNKKTRGLSATDTVAGGGIVMLGGYRPPFIYPFNSELLLVDGNCDTLWTKPGVTNHYTVTGALHQLRNGDFLAAGATWGLIPTDEVDMYLSRYSSAGTLRWSRPIGYIPSPEHATDFIELPDGDLILAATQRDSVGAGFSTCFLIYRLDSLGNTRWRKAWCGNAYNLLNLVATPDSNFIAQGISIIGSVAQGLSSHPFFVKFDHNGDTLFTRSVIMEQLGESEVVHYSINHFRGTSDGGYLLTGMISQTGTGHKRPFLLRLDAQLRKVWHFSEPLPSAFADVWFTQPIEQQDSSILVLATELQLSNQYRVLRFNASGSIVNTYTFASAFSLRMYPFNMIYVRNGNYFISGWSDSAIDSIFSDHYYWATIGPLGVPSVYTGTPATVAPARNWLGEAYPNPTTGTVTIPYSLPAGTKQARLVVYELALGRELRSMALTAEQSRMALQLHELPSGLYGYRLEADGRLLQNRKLALVK